MDLITEINGEKFKIDPPRIVVQYKLSTERLLIGRHFTSQTKLNEFLNYLNSEETLEYYYTKVCKPIVKNNTRIWKKEQ